MITLDTIRCYEVSKKVMADFYKNGKLEEHLSGYGNLPLNDYLDDIKQLFEGKEAIELNEIKTRLQSIYTDVVDIVKIDNQ